MQGAIQNGGNIKEEKILFQIKSLEQKIYQYFLQNHPLTCTYQKMSKPTPTQIQIIEYLVRHMNDEVYQRDLEKVFSLKRATISGVLQTMEKNGLISRVVDDTDTRKKKILLQEKTKEIFLQGKAKIEEIEQILLQNISEKELENFWKTLNQMKKNMESVLKK